MDDEYIEWAKDIMSEAINEGKKMKPFKKVKVGDKATDYNGDVWGVLAVGKVKDLMKYDDSGSAEELDPNEDAIALDGRGGTAVFSYDPDGAAVYEKVKDLQQDVEYTALKDNIFGKAKKGDKVRITGFGNSYHDIEYEVHGHSGPSWEKSEATDADLMKYLKESVNESKKIKESFSKTAGKFLMELDKATFEDAAAAFLLDLPGSDAIDETFEVKKLGKDNNYKWEFEVTSKVDSKVHKALTKAGVEFGTVHGKLFVMGDTNDEKIRAMEILKSFDIDESFEINEGVLTIAGGIILGVVGVIALVNGAQVAAIVAGKAIVNAAEKADAKKAAKRAADKLADKKAILEPIVKKFENDDVLKKMYAELTPYMGTSNAKNRAASKLRTKEMAEVAKYIKSKLTPEELGYFTDLSKYLRTGTFENNEFYLDAKRVDEKLNKKTLQVEEGDGEDIDDMIDDLADGDEDETQGPDDSAPDGEDSPESKIKDGESPEDAVDGDASSKIAAATKELEKDSKKLAKLKKILLDESSTNEELTRMVNDGAMSELHLLAKEAKDEADFLKKAKSFAKDMDIKIEGGLEKMFKEFYSDMKNESVKETKEVTIDDDGKEVEDEENITDTKTGDEIQVEEPQEESTSNAYMDAVTEGLKHRFNK